MNEKTFTSRIEEESVVAVQKLSIIGKDYVLTNNGIITGRKSIRSVMDALSVSLVDWVAWDKQSLWINFYDDKEDIIKLSGEYNEWNVELWTDGDSHTIKFNKGKETRKFKYSDLYAACKFRDLVDYIPFGRR